MTDWRVRTALSGGSGGAGLSTMYFDATGGLTAQNAATAVRTFWATIANRISNNYTMTVEPLVYEINASTGQPVGVTGTTTTPVSGTDSADEEPWATQGLIFWNTGNFIGGREIRGRTFVPGPTSVSGSGGAPAAAYTAGLASAAAALIADVNTDLEVYSRLHTSAVSVSAASVWSKWAVLRSRRD